MQTTTNQPLRRAVFGCVIVLSSGAIAAAQAPKASSLPPSAPTSSVSPSQMPSANPPVVSSISPSHSEISWNGNTLQVVATNASLSQLMQEIAAKANLKITGSTPEDRVFGTYGPGKLEDVLSELLDGMAINMLFVDRPGTQAKQLVLTSRSGGPIPSSQNQQGQDGNGARSSPSQNDVGQAPQPPQNVPLPYAAPSAPSDGAASSTDTPPGVRTPQQIFEQLQRLRQQANQK